MTKFEQLPNELILMCFHYFDFYHLYEIFYYLNQRFNELIEYQTKIYIDLSPIPSKKFLRFCFQLNQLITASQNYPLSIVASDEHKFNLIFDDLFKDQFSKLKSLTLSDINAATIDDIIFDEPTKLYEKLERLSLLGTISRGDGGIVDTECLCVGLISSEMKSLKYLNLNFNPDEPDCTFDECYATTIIDFHTMIENLLPYLPKLKTLSIKSLGFEEYDSYQQSKVSSITTTTNSILPLKLE
ncbi:unnamed protein product, partial [Rotaria sp. Silwood1]